MNRRDLALGLIGVAIIIGVLYWQGRSEEEQTQIETPETLSVQDKIEDQFKVEIPEDVGKAELKDITGGTSSALATRKFAANQFKMTVLADLPDLSSGYYQAWVTKPGSETDRMSLGALRQAKGGWMVDFRGTTDLSSYSQVRVTEEQVLDLVQEKVILEGAFD